MAVTSEQKFFYANEDATLYDDTIELVAPYYRAMHETMLRLAVENGNRSDRAPIALDIGCGTGAEAIALLRTLPQLKLIGVDLCAPMLEEFQRNANTNKVEAARYVLKTTDILDPGAAAEIRGAVSDSFGASQFQIILSAFTLHHFDKRQREAIFRLVFELMAGEGIFLLGDLFNYDGESAWLTDVIQEWELSWIANNFDEKVENAAGKGDKAAAAKLSSLKRDWIRHYLQDNRLSGILHQMQELRDIGFTDVANPFRYWQVGLVCAKKPQ